MASFSIALSGLTAASSDLDVTANNIANADTVGFKQSRAEFADVFAAGAVNLNTSPVGEGVRLATTAQQFTQGNISTSGSNLDLAISGDGFFTLQDPSSGIVYTRNGQFSEDKNGNVVTATGQALQVYPPTTTGGFNTGALTDLNLQTAQSTPLATTAGTVILNLPAGSTPPTGGAFNPANPATYNFSANSASGTHCLIMPQAAACSAASLLPSKANPNARALPTRRGRVQVPPESGSSPSLANACTKLAELAAMTRSQARAMLAPAPAATPLTAAITGIGRECNASTKGL